MSGERRKRFSAVFFAAIMVTSMVALGAAGFAGSAAALDGPVEQPADTSEQTIYGDPGGSIVANNATSGENSTHSIDVTAGSFADNADTSSGGTSGAVSVNISYPSEFRIHNLQNSDISANIAGSDFNNGDIYESSLNASGNNYVNVTFDTDGDGGGTNNDVNLQSGDQIKIDLSNDKIQNPGTDGLYNVSVEANITSDLGTNGLAEPNTESTSTDLPLSLPGPVEERDASGNTVDHYTTIGDAVANASDSEAHTIVVPDGEFREQGTTIDINNDDQTITNANGATPVVNISGSTYVQQSSDSATVENLEFEGDSQSETAITDSTNPVNGTFSNNVFLNFTGSDVINLAPGNSGGDDTLEVVNNEFSETIDSRAINVNEGSTGDSTDLILIEDNDITVTDGSDAIQLLGGGGSAAVTVRDNTIDGDGNNVIGVDLDTTGSIGGEVEISGGTIDDVDKGVDASDGTSTVNSLDITGVTLRNVSQNNQVGIDLTGDLGSPTVVNVADLDADLSSGATMVDIGSSEVDVNVTNANINDVATGVKISNVYEQATVNESTISNASTAGVDFDAAGEASDEYVVKDNTFEDSSGNGLQVTTSGTQVDNKIHFNTFRNNSNGIDVNDGSFDAPINAQFNEFLDNNNNGLNVQAMGTGASDANVTANYSWWDNRDYSRIVGPYTPQNAESQLLSPQRVYSYTRLHTGGQP